VIAEPGRAADLAVAGDLRARLREAIARNDAASATRIARHLADREPGDEQAQTWLSTCALGDGDIAAARREAELGLRHHPGSVALNWHLANALAAAGDHEPARGLYDKVWRADTRRVAALLQRGVQEEALGRRTDMLRSYREALAAFREANLLRADAPLAPRTKAALNHASRMLAEQRKAAFDDALAPLRERYGAAALRRIDDAIAGYLGLIRLEWPHPLQKPTLLLIPGLPPQPWFDPADFPFFREIESRTDAIREELLAVLAQEDELRPYVRMRPDAPGEPVWRELNGSPNWSAYHFYNSGVRVDAHCAACPTTTAAMDALPLVRLPGCSPEVLFSILRPHTHIPPHTGVINGRLTVHLPLIVPRECGALACGHEARPWIEGKCFVFDDSIAHEAINQSDHTRVVLIFDTWNPYLGEAERAALGAAFEAILGSKADIG
jgi:aspartate beta-hydroxylase